MTTASPSITLISLGVGTSAGFAINASGQVAAELYNAGQEAKVWQSGSVTSLANLYQDQNWVKALNDSGVVVGYSLLAAGQAAVEWTKGVVAALPTFVKAANPYGDALDINNQGEIVGYSLTASGVADPTLWQNGIITDLGILPGALVPAAAFGVRSGLARAINNAGQIVGESYNSAGLLHAVEWINGKITDLGAVDAQSQSQAVAINKVGQIIGVGFTGAGPVQALTWQNGKIAQLGTLAGDNEAYTTGINSAGVIVGYADNSSDVSDTVHAVIWENGSVIDLNSLLPANSGWVLGEANGINDQGQVTGWGTYNGQHQAFVLSLNSAPVTSATVSSALVSLGTGATGVTLSESAADVLANLDVLSTYSSTGRLTTIHLTDSGIPNLEVTGAQLSSDRTVFNAMDFDNFSLTVTAPGGGVVGYLGHGTTVVFSGDASAYTVSASPLPLQITVQSSSTNSLLASVTALKFDDVTEIVAQAPTMTGPITSGNVTELYGAVFGREPDVPGLAYYEAQMHANQSLSMGTLAQWFLASPEYTNNPAHAYAPSSAGDAQFIADIYQNLLHRAPETGAVPFYQAIIQQFTQGLAPGSAAYLAAQTAGHATVLVDFSNSAEFLGDVQITAQHPADAQHWLLLTL